MKIIATYCNSTVQIRKNYVWDQYFRNQSYPDGFKKETIVCNSLEELETKVLVQRYCF